MEYKEGIDRLAINGNEENFPYPLKLWYDDNNIYVKVLRLPDLIEAIVSGTEGDETPWLCFEVSTWKHCRLKSGYGIGRGIGKFFISSRIEAEDLFYCDPGSEDYITIPRSIINGILDGGHYNRNKNNMSANPPYLLCRGCIRLSRPNEFHSAYSFRTNIISNTAKIYKNN